MQKTIATATAVVLGAAGAGTVARSLEDGTFGTGFMLGTIGLVIAGTITFIKIAEWHFARTAPKRGHNH